MREAAKQEGRTVLYVSHNMNTIRQLCDRCIVLSQGKIIYDGEVEEAISKYLNTEMNDKPFIDYEDIPRLKWLVNTKVKTLNAKYKNKKNILFSQGEDLVVILQWLNEKTIEDLSLRVEILNVERRPIATSFLYDFYSGNEGDYNEIEISVDLSSIAPGRYATNYVFFQHNQYGGNSDVDCVHGLYFEIAEDDKLPWNERSWGRVHLPDIELH